MKASCEGVGLSHRGGGGGWGVEGEREGEKVETASRRGSVSFVAEASRYKCRFSRERGVSGEGGEGVPLQARGEALDSTLGSMGKQS